MNKITKASIATGTGVVLLMGGAASLAYWNSEADLGATGQSITAGTLTVTASENTDGDGWTKAFSGDGVETAPATVTDVDDVLVVPGNVLEYTQTFDINAAGDDLYFSITDTEGSITAVAGGAAADGALQTILDANSVIAVADISSAVNVEETATDGVYHFTNENNAGTAEIVVTWTITWPWGDEPTNNGSGDNAAKGGVVSLTQEGALTVTQVADPAATAIG